MGLLSKSMPGMKQHLSSMPQCPDDEIKLLKQYPAKLMQHQEEPTLKLAQKINQIVANRLASASMLQEIAQALGVAFQVDCCFLATLKGKESGEAISANWCAQEYPGLTYPREMLSIEHLDLPVVLQCVSEQLTVEDISIIESSLKTGFQYLPIPTKTILAISTKFTGQSNGVIALIKSQPYEWSESEKQLLKALEPCCAIAFAQVAQVQAMSWQQSYLQTCHRHQSLIKQLTILSRSNLELNQMLQLAIASTAEALGVERSLLILLKYTDPLFRTRSKGQIPKAKASVIGEWCQQIAIDSNDQLKNLNHSFGLSDCDLCQRAFMENGKPIVINDYVNQKDSLVYAPVLALETLPSVLLMRLESQGKVLGFLVLQQKTARNWTDMELNMVEMVCAQLSNSIIQTQTLRQVQNLVDERTAQLQRSLEVQAKLYERTRQYVEQLRELNALKDEFLSNMSDRLRYPLTNMQLALRMLRQTGVSPERQTKYLDILEQECTKEINLINDLLTLQKLETDQERPQFETIEINTKIQEIAASFEKKFLDKGLSVSLELPTEPLTLQTEVESFDRILQEILSNACKYSEHDTAIQLQAVHQVIQEIDQIVIKVTNIGPGISKQEATYIFDKFRRGKGRWTPGTGLGLALVKSLVQHLNGGIAVESIPLESSSLSKVCFTLTLPQFPDSSKPYSDSD